MAKMFLISGILISVVLVSVAAAWWKMTYLDPEPVEAYIDEIRAAEFRYQRQHGQFVSADPSPPGEPGQKKRKWEPSLGFEKLGWAPPGRVRCSYSVIVSGQAFTIEAACDEDGDGVKAGYGYMQPKYKSRVGIDGYFGICSPYGVYSMISKRQIIFGKVGPCRDVDGLSVR